MESVPGDVWRTAMLVGTAFAKQVKAPTLANAHRNSSGVINPGCPPGPIIGREPVLAAP
jgi:hypothetical protein